MDTLAVPPVVPPGMGHVGDCGVSVKVKTSPGAFIPSRSFSPSSTRYAFCRVLITSYPSTSVS